MNDEHCKDILELFLGDDADRILRGHTTFSIDWFTDNKNEAPLRVTPSKNRGGINNLIEDESVNNSISGGLYDKNLILK